MSVVKHFLFILAVACISYASAEETSRKLICRYSNKSKYLEGDGQFTVDNIPEFCTHYVYVYAKINEDYLITPSDDGDADDISKFVALKEKFPDAKFAICIKEPSGSYWFNLVNNRYLKRKFINNIAKYLRSYNFDGFEIDFRHFDFGEEQEYFNPQLYGQLFKELTDFFEKEADKSGKDQLFVSIFAPQSFDFEFNVDYLNDFVEWLGVFKYIKETSSEPSFLSHVSPIYAAENEVSVDRSISYFLDHGASAEKIALAIPFIGKTFDLLDRDTYDLGMEARGPGISGPYTKINGTMGYFELCQIIKDEGWIVEDKSDDHGPFAHWDHNWVSYDDETSVMQKVEYAEEKDLGGIIIMLSLDDYKGNCHGISLPLSQKIVDTFLNK